MVNPAGLVGQAAARPGLAGVSQLGSGCPLQRSVGLTLPPPRHPCPGLGFEANWRPALLSLSALQSLGEFREADQLGEEGVALSPCEHPHPRLEPGV